MNHRVSKRWTGERTGRLIAGAFSSARFARRTLSDRYRILPCGRIIFITISGDTVTGRGRNQRLTTSAKSLERLDFIDLFAGIGGMRLAFESTGATCVFTSEWDRFAQLTYAKNFGDGEIHGDIRQIHEATIPDHDVLVGGFPCQPFSLAGVSKKNALGRAHGFACDAQGTLFWEVARILKEKRPRAFMLENVKNLISHDRGQTLRVIMKTLEVELGYTVHWKVLDAQLYLPQHRERIFIIGFREPTALEWPVVADPHRITMSSILHPENGKQESEEPYTQGKRGAVNPKYVLSDALWTYLKNYSAKHRALGNGFGYGLVTPESVSRTLSARYHKDGSEILVDRGRRNPRRLTPREAARLMGYSDDWKIPVSDTQAYRQFGNSVAVPLVSAVAQSVVAALGSGGRR